MSEEFIIAARERLEYIGELIGSVRLPGEESEDSGVANMLADEMAAMFGVLEAAIDAVDSDGSVPSALCTAVVRFARAAKSEGK